MTVPAPQPSGPKYPRLFAFWGFCTTKLASAIFKTVEALTVLGLFFLALWVGGFLVFGDVSSATRQRMVGLVQLVNDNWKSFLLLAVLLFYRPIRTFLEEAQEIASVKRRSSPEGAPSEQKNPPAVKP